MFLSNTTCFIWW